MVERLRSTFHPSLHVEMDRLTLQKILKKIFASSQVLAVNLSAVIKGEERFSAQKSGLACAVRDLLGPFDVVYLSYQGSKANLRNQQEMDDIVEELSDLLKVRWHSP